MSQSCKDALEIPETLSLHATAGNLGGLAGMNIFMWDGRGFIWPDRAGWQLQGGDNGA